MIERYSFLVLSLLFLVPPSAILLLRRDLRGILGLTAVLSLPFAATEFLFYPTYWNPETLFDLVQRIGFGIEDVLFVVGLGMLSAGIYPFVFGKRVLREASEPRGAMCGRAAVLLISAGVAVAVASAVGVHMIYAAPVVMVVADAAILLRRSDLLAPSVVGGLLTVCVYGGLSLLFQLLIPGVFELDWNTDEFLNVFVLGIPVEELMYGFSAGLVGSVFVPYVLRARFV